MSWSSINNGPVDHFVQHRHANKVLSSTNEVANSWMQVDLGENRTLRPTHYCLRNDVVGGCARSPTFDPSSSPNGYALRNWRLEGSNDGQTWTTLRNHAKDESLSIHQSMSEANWSIDGCAVRYRWFRILQSEQHDDIHYNFLCCAGIELYGDLDESTHHTNSKKKKAPLTTLASLVQLQDDCTPACRLHASKDGGFSKNGGHHKACPHYKEPSTPAVVMISVD